MGGCESYEPSLGGARRVETLRADDAAALRSRLLVAETRPPEVSQPLAGLSVLVVDDNGINREFAERILSREGALVSKCIDGRQAVEAIRTNSQCFDVVLMDVQMPVLDGYDATRTIRTELGLFDLPIIAVTAGALVEERERALGAGMNEFVTKPLRPVDLVRKLADFVPLRKKLSA